MSERETVREGREGGGGGGGEGGREGEREGERESCVGLLNKMWVGLLAAGLQDHLFFSYGSYVRCTELDMSKQRRKTTRTKTT